jgi:hypothetical protein
VWRDSSQLNALWHVQIAIARSAYCWLTGADMTLMQPLLPRAEQLQ